MKVTLWLALVTSGCQVEATSTADSPASPNDPTAPAPNTDPCPPVTVYADTDGDGFGDVQAPLEVCEPGPGQAELPGDCDDTHPAVWPGAPEIDGDGVDNDCDPETTPAPPITDLTLVDRVIGNDPGDVLWMSSLGDLDGDGADDFVANVLRAFAPAQTGLIHGPPGSGTFGDLATEVFEANRWIASPLDITGDGRGDFVATDGWPLQLITGGTTSVARIGSLDQDASLPYNGTVFSRDLTGDGQADLVLQVDGEVIGSAEPAIVILPGPISGVVWASTGIVVPLEERGLLATGDLDGDGVDDLVWAEGTDDADVLVRYGPITEAFDLLTAPDARLSGPGWISTLEVDGDLDGDGAEELMVSRGDPRVLEVVYGQRFADGPLVGDVQLELSVFSWPDVEIVSGVSGTEHASLMVGDYSLNDFAGGVEVFHGPLSGLLDAADWSFAGVEDYDLLGYAIDAVDWDGDGAPELVLSSNGAHDMAGAIYMVDIPVW